MVYSSCECFFVKKCTIVYEEENNKKSIQHMGEISPSLTINLAAKKFVRETPRDLQVEKIRKVALIALGTVAAFALFGGFLFLSLHDITPLHSIASEGFFGAALTAGVIGGIAFSYGLRAFCRAPRQIKNEEIFKLFDTSKTCDPCQATEIRKTLFTRLAPTGSNFIGGIEQVPFYETEDSSPFFTSSPTDVILF